MALTDKIALFIQFLRNFTKIHVYYNKITFNTCNYICCYCKTKLSWDCDILYLDYLL